MEYDRNRTPCRPHLCALLSSRRQASRCGLGCGLDLVMMWGSLSSEKLDLVRNSITFLFFILFIFFMQRKDSSVVDMTIIEDLNAVNTTPFSHQVGLSLKRLQLCICASYSDKHIQVQFLNCGSHSSKPASCLSQFH